MPTRMGCHGTMNGPSWMCLLRKRRHSARRRRRKLLNPAKEADDNSNNYIRRYYDYNQFGRLLCHLCVLPPSPFDHSKATHDPSCRHALNRHNAAKTCDDSNDNRGRQNFVYSQSRLLVSSPYIPSAAKPIESLQDDAGRLFGFSADSATIAFTFQSQYQG